MIEEIVVIGSHIKMDPEEALSPVTSIDREELRYQGSPTVLDMIINLPFSQGADGESDRFQGGGGGSGVGPDRATINIRGLGPSRSLVLINGRRTTWSPIPIGADTQLLVDVNMLPFIALNNIDFLRDGAAASYGSDAIAGVMNFETRSDFTGIEISANHKVIRGSGGDTEVGFIGGMDFADAAEGISRPLQAASGAVNSRYTGATGQSCLMRKTRKEAGHPPGGLPRSYPAAARTSTRTALSIPIARPWAGRRPAETNAAGSNTHRLITWSRKPGAGRVLPRHPGN